MTELPLLSRLNRIASSSSIDKAWGHAVAHFRALGFGRINYGFTRFRHLKTIGDPDDALFLTTCDADYVQRYFFGGFYPKTPVFPWAERNSGACTRTWVKEIYEGRTSYHRRGRRGAAERRHGGRRRHLDLFPRGISPVRGCPWIDCRSGS